LSIRAVGANYANHAVAKGQGGGQDALLVVFKARNIAGDIHARLARQHCDAVIGFLPSPARVITDGRKSLKRKLVVIKLEFLQA